MSDHLKFTEVVNNNFVTCVTALFSFFPIQRALLVTTNCGVMNS